MKKFLVLILSMLMVLSFFACGGDTGGFEVPDVFGINYIDATEILESEGFEVKAVETSVETISEKLLYPLEKVDKGTVFKVDDYILDNLGNLTKDYDVFYDGEFISKDQSLVIYDAKEEYVSEKVSSKEDDTTTEPVQTTTSSETTSTTAEEKEGLRSDFKEAMDSYESFMDKYVAFMKKYKDNPTDLSLLTDYADYMSKYADFVADFEKWESDDMNAAELAYYLDVQTRVTKKLAEVAF